MCVLYIYNIFMRIYSLKLTVQAGLSMTTKRQPVYSATGGANAANTVTTQSSRCATVNIV